MNRKEKTLLSQYYDPQRYHVEETTSLRDVRRYLHSKMAMCWGNGPMQDLPFHKLCQPSPQRKGDKQLVLICRKSLVAQAERMPQ